MEENKNNKGLIWLIVILIILVLGLIGYIVNDKVLSKDKKPINNESTTTTTSSINENEELKVLNGTFTLSNNKYSYVCDNESLKVYLDNELVYSDKDYAIWIESQYLEIKELGDYVMISAGATGCLSPFKIFDKEFNNKINKDVCPYEYELDNEIFKYGNNDCDYSKSNPNIHEKYEFDIKTGENRLVEVTERNAGYMCD